MGLSGHSVVCTGPRWNYVNVGVKNAALQIYSQTLFLYGTYLDDLSVPLREGLLQVPRDRIIVGSLYQLRLP